jgi:hypothetical protein
MQSPSFLAQQRQFEEGYGRSTANNLFGIAKIPTGNHIRDMLDAVYLGDDLVSRQPLCLAVLDAGGHFLFV